MHSSRYPEVNLNPSRMNDHPLARRRDDADRAEVPRGGGGPRDDPVVDREAALVTAAGDGRTCAPCGRSGDAEGPACPA